MDGRLYSTESYSTALFDEKTLAIAFKYDPKAEVKKQYSVITLKTTDNLLSRIKYYATWFFYGYSSPDINFQRKYYTRVKELEEQVVEFQREAKTHRDPAEALAIAKSELSAAEAKLRTAERQEKEKKSEVSKLESELAALKKQITHETMKKMAVETLIVEGQAKLSQLHEDHWKQVKDVLKGEKAKSPGEYLEAIRKRMEEKHKIVNENFDKSITHEKEDKRRSISELASIYITSVPEIRGEIHGGSITLDQKSKLFTDLQTLRNIEQIAQGPHHKQRLTVIDALKELIDLDYRFRDMNHT